MDMAVVVCVQPIVGFGAAFGSIEDEEVASIELMSPGIAGAKGVPQKTSVKLFAQQLLEARL